MNIKKGILLFTLLFVSVITTACINNFAVQELNNRAKDFLAKGDTQNAICRLESSIDLDPSIFETQYNLAIAYIDAEFYEKAEKTLLKAIELKPDFADAYYSLAVAQEGIAFEKLEPKKDVEQDEKISVDFDKEIVKIERKDKISNEDREFVVEKLTEAIQNYSEFLSYTKDSQNKEKAQDRINYLNSQINKYNSNEIKGN